MLSNCSDSPSSVIIPHEQESSESSQITKYNLKERTRGKTKVNMWKKAENYLLFDIMTKTSELTWIEISNLFNKHNERPRKPKDIAEHWNRVLCAQHRKWTDEEDQKLIAAVEQCKTHDWKAIKRLVTQRTNNQIITRLRTLKTRAQYKMAFADEKWP